METVKPMGQVEDSAGKSPWLPFIMIIAASAAAHLWCLGSQFYLDDITAIRDSAAVRDGIFWKTFANTWTYLGYVIQYKLFGMNPVAFHAVNWLLHTAVACVLFGFGRNFVKGRAPEGVALFAALLFAVHPLASEIPNYARTQDLAWVTLFSIIASWSLLRFLQGQGALNLLWMVLGIVGATLSKGPGLFHVLMMTVAVALAFMTRDHWQLFRRRIWWVMLVFLLGIGALWVSGFLPRLIGATRLWEGPRFIGHAYTLARVFWEFAWRAVIPVGLCSDHQIAETMVPPGSGWFGIPDKVAMNAALGMLSLTAVSLVLAWRTSTRLFGVCLFLFVATMLFRVAYIVPEFMPEYRIYPGMPWFCLGVAILLGALWSRIPGGGSPKWVAAIILLPCVILSAKRSFVWHDLEKLTADVLRQYPAQARAVWELHDRDMENKDWQKIITRQQTMWPPVLESFITQFKRLQPARDLNSGHFALADIACRGRVAIALAHTQGPPAGIAEIRRIEAHMHGLGIQPETNRTIWGYYHHARAVVMEMAGAYPQALESMRFEGVFSFTQADIDRLEKKMAGKAN